MKIYLVFFLLITLSFELKAADQTYPSFAEDGQTQVSEMGGNENRNDIAQKFLSIDMKPEQQSYSKVLRSAQQMQQILPPLGSGNFTVVEDQQDRVRLLNSDCEKWSDIIDTLNWSGGVGSDAFYAQEMEPYITESVLEGNDPLHWGKKKPFYTFAIKPGMEAELNQPAFLSQKSARRYLLLRNLHAWLSQHLAAANMALPTKSSLVDEQNDLFTSYFEGKNLWPLQDGLGSYNKNLEKFREMIQLVAAGGFNGDLEEIFFNNLENEIYQLPSEELLVQEQSSITDQEGSDQEQYPTWSLEKTNAEALDQNEPQQQVVRLLFQQDFLGKQSETEVPKEGSSAKTGKLKKMISQSQDPDHKGSNGVLSFQLSMFVLIFAVYGFIVMMTSGIMALIAFMAFIPFMLFILVSSGLPLPQSYDSEFDSLDL